MQSIYDTITPKTPTHVSLCRSTEDSVMQHQGQPSRNIKGNRNTASSKRGKLPRSYAPHLSATISLELTPHMRIRGYKLRMHACERQPLVAFLEVAGAQVVGAHEVEPTLNVVNPAAHPRNVRFGLELCVEERRVVERDAGFGN
jgi:hypothetical protein